MLVKNGIVWHSNVAGIPSAMGWLWALLFARYSNFEGINQIDLDVGNTQDSSRFCG
ncbi:MAG: hypothetical protein ACI841_004237 [Planctomycetota bacterium]|jgi:hypothetical protein